MVLIFKNYTIPTIVILPMERPNQNVINTLNELVQINNDRIAGYHQASHETKDGDLEQLFTSMLNESVNFAETLGAYIREMGGEPATGGTTGGHIHQAWLDFKTALTGNNRIGLLESCEFGDKSAIEAYITALKEEAIQQDEELKGVLFRQQAAIESSLKIIQTLTPRTNSTQAEQAALKIQQQ
ncbi:ferritin-like domain-containing protein [Runella sp.]|uniref:ferritin-like domain-containing protein n=1 Tax=Runella sp. TaxID=1960881 RepID=UPI003D107AE4